MDAKFGNPGLKLELNPPSPGNEVSFQTALILAPFASDPNEGRTGRLVHECRFPHEARFARRPE
jgi:hypothetical protein